MIDQRFDPDKVKVLSGGIPRWFELGYELV